MWTSELIPTTVRNAGVGSYSFAARIGGVGFNKSLYRYFYSLFQILATTLGVLAEISPNIPTAMFATCALISGVLSLLLPETHGEPLPDSPEESETIQLITVSKLCTVKLNPKSEDE